VNNIISKQNISNQYELVVLMPKILGDAMMSVQALHCYPEFSSDNLLVITDSIYQNLFALIFKSHTVKSYSEISETLTTKKIIDFRADLVSKLTKINFNYQSQYSFDFGEQLSISILEDSNKYAISFSEINENFDQEDLRNQHAWFMDTVLVSTALKVPLRYPHQTLKPHTCFKNIVCFPCGSNNLKHYPLENWLLIIKQLINNGFNVTIFLGNTEKQYTDQFSEVAPTFLNMPLESVVTNYFSEDTLVIANDCGPLHVAAWFGLKVVGIFGPTNEKIWFPYQYGQAIRCIHSEWPTIDEVSNVINLMLKS
jgi:hypothetical protein